MKTHEFYYDLPRELIAQHPLPQRDRSRMLVVFRAGKRIEHSHVVNLPDYLSRGDLMLFNNTRVVPSRLIGHKSRTGGRVELLLLEEGADQEWTCLLKSSRRPKPGDILEFAKGKVRMVFVENADTGQARIRIVENRIGPTWRDEIGLPPLPPYIHRNEDDNDQVLQDLDRYQTIYARSPGAVAAPTAGLHFTQDLLQTLDRRRIDRASLTLHVGPGTFRPVTVDDIEDHKMEAERFSVPEETWSAIKSVHNRPPRLVAVGTTTVRVLESLAGQSPPGSMLSGTTSLFITPPYRFCLTGGMLTNFHLPCSTLLMMVCAFAGKEAMLDVYREAIEKKYRFYSYGDCMLIL